MLTPRRSKLFNCFLLALTLTPAWGVTRHVPGDWPTLQQALQASQDGDTVLAAPGNHAGPLDYIGRQVRVASVAGPAQTFIWMVGPGALVRFVSAEGPGAELEGFTLSGGEATAEVGVCGGAILVEDASPLIRGNIIRDNQAVLGGGVCLLGGSARLEDNNFELNVSELGGGLYVQQGNAQITGNRFMENLAQGAGYGGGLALEDAPAIVSNNVFLGNSARLGGALSCRGQSGQAAEFMRNSMAGNGAPFGGGCYLLSCTPELEACVLAFATEGAAIWCNQAEPRLSCNISHGNAGGDALCGADQGGNLYADPLFCNVGQGDLRLSPGSPCWSTACGVAGALDLDCDGLDLPPRSSDRPQTVRLDPASPNPFNPETRLRITLSQPCQATVRIYDLAGREVAELLNGPVPAGTREIRFLADSLPSGVYIAVLRADHVSLTQKLLLLK